MLMRRMAALAIIASVCCGAGRPAVADMVDDLISKTKEADQFKQVAQPISTLSRANCAAGNAVLSGIAEQNPDAVRRALSTAREGYDASYKRIIESVGTGKFKQPFDKEKLRLLQKYSDTDLKEIATREDLLRRIAEIVKQSSEALDRIQAGKPEKDDLARVIANSTEITRLIAAFYDLTGV
ncbi:hypothetical protein [Bradyrhizobium mercantei]|uniref:hypothetical protein n=1 Tax=Bradyrhizobium mercantei TaxID=1904807 RepID=UPI0011777129|nr:hypothetical protein [Bradyrhizobium mercantei]